MPCDTTVHKYSHHIFLTLFFLKSLLRSLLTAWIFQGCRQPACCLVGCPRWTMGGLRQGDDSQCWATLSVAVSVAVHDVLLLMSSFNGGTLEWLCLHFGPFFLFFLSLASIRDRRASIAEATAVQTLRVISSCHGRSQCDPKNMGKNITIFFKKGNLLTH